MKQMILSEKVKMLGELNTCFEDVDIVEPKVRSVESSENEKFFLADGTGRVVGSFERNVTSALDLAPLDVILHDLDCVDLA